jgi:hypothetical protein
LGVPHIPARAGGSRPPHILAEDILDFVPYPSKDIVVTATVPYLQREEWGNKLSWTQSHARFQVSKIFPGTASTIMPNLVEIGATVWNCMNKQTDARCLIIDIMDLKLLLAGQTI